MNKIGIMGGTFNPIHIAHLILAESAYEQLQLDKILIMPSKKPPHKLHEPIVSDHHRKEMVRLAIDGNPHFEMSSMELDREGITYTADTLQQLTKDYPENEYYFILGWDSLQQIEKWREPDTIFRLAHIVAAGRYHSSKDKIEDQVHHLNKIYHGKIHVLEIPNMDLSSEMLREYIKSGKSIRYYVPSQVEQYIRDHGLYAD
ncbi:nicotinate-nucleotide adenylyltransferase [Anaerocolumna sp.]|uniref:nicotinate-nucleotide adenylyltransferase n=1 Tax=Anaerocolumna sp. TaxID=2041569 RepID=UPI0028ABB30B|nr:nicotinate-nucleotide adenylyltransferase [Anaerocolumna sp.]